MTSKVYNILTNPIVFNYLQNNQYTYGDFRLPVKIGDLELDYVLQFHRLDGACQSEISALNNGSVFIRPEEDWSHIVIDWNRKMKVKYGAEKYHEKLLNDLFKLVTL